MSSKMTISNCRVGGNITMSSDGTDPSEQRVSNVKVGGEIKLTSTATQRSMIVDGVELVAWGVKCLVDQGFPGQGWYGKDFPVKYTEGEARVLADKLNAKNDGDKWEARRFDA